MTKIISFSLWGSNPKYTEPSITNVNLARKYYPDWTCRFYHDETVPMDIITELNNLGAETIRMPRSDGNYGMFWRFLPLGDTNIERFIVRDTDSRLNPREADAVNEWINSGKAFHTMRDNKWHNVVPVCGGMWGAIPSKLNFNYEDQLKSWLSLNMHRVFKHPRGKYFFVDQTFLADRLWPLVVNKSLAHEGVPSTYPGSKKNFNVENPDGSFVGQPFEY